MRGRLRDWRVRAVALIWLSVAGLCAGQQATLVGDAHVSSARPTVNAGGLSNLDVGGGSTALVQFDLGVLPTGTTAAQVTRATLRVYCNRADTAGTVSVQGVSGAWTEGALTYATLPGLGPVLQSATVAGAGGFVTFDVTGLVQGWVGAPGTNFGLALTSGTAVVQFDSKENDQTSHAPELEMVLATGSVVAGAQGATGATGAVGATGAQGVAGVVGATGAAGVAGAKGATGTTGIVGATGAVGATGSAGIAGATGVSGLNGVTGLVGATGAIGATGSIGATGLQGIAGVTGATGAAGFAYQGVYSSVANYGLGDVVVWQGASYTLLVAGNRGQTPSLSPGYWGTLTAVGATGAAGVAGPVGGTGATGAIGPVGPAGQQGQMGTQGVAGQAGAQGIPGIVGATGAAGAVGPQGVAGPVGLSYQGAYSSVTNYGLGDGVLWQGAGYVSLVAGNHGNTPDVSPGMWSMFASAGSAGVAGATGAVGATGAAGANGLNGATGAVGTMGVTGATGAVGMSYQGVYSSATNYGLGDVVEFGGAGYVSLVAGNRGQTPGLSTGSWGLLAAVGGTGLQGVTGATGSQGVQGLVGPAGVAGPAGVQGVAGPQGPVGAQGLAGANGAVGPQGPAGQQGIAGQAGAQGIAGVAGATGLQGPAGIAGATGAAGSLGATGATGGSGSPGLVWQGAWSSVTNYALNDVVAWQGSSYVAVGGLNAGQTPGVSPQSWSLVASVGATGVQGTVGATGVQGVQGVAGVQGVVGPQGLQGATGPAGPAGAQGLSGAQGLQGAQGAVGPQGVAGQAGAQGIAGATGATGAQGAAGVAGAAGATGATGAVGANGLNGIPGLTWRGAWSSATNYAVNDAVGVGGTSYVSLTSNNVGQAPVGSPSNWAVLAAAGSVGASGVAGATGGTGAVGATGAQGVAGSTGATGSAGAVGMNFRSGWTAGTSYAVNDAVTFAGSSYLALAGNKNAEPDVSPQQWAVLAQAGGAGPTGAAGASATVSIGTVTTLAAGATATVTNSGTGQTAVLNFGIPQGVAGAAGSSGGSGGAGIGSFGAMYHAVSFSTLYYSVNSPTSAASESGGAVMAWVPQGCTATRMDVYSQQSGSIKVTLRAGLPGSVTDTALVCSPATNGSCSATGSVAITAGSFVDYRIDSASGTVAGVWTALTCQ